MTSSEQPDDCTHARGGRRFLRVLAIAGAAIAGLVLLALLILWLLRFRIATDLVDRKLAAADVPASYRLTRLGPFLQRLEDVRIGAPDAPDLTARRIDVTIGYGLTGPAVRAITVDGVRLRARIGPGGFSLGTIDRLLPATRGGQTRLPDLDLTIGDTHVALATPNGAFDLAVEGSGNPRRVFRGTAQARATALRLASCRLAAVRADVRIGAEQGRPHVAGPIRIGRTNCPALRLGAGVARVEASSNQTFDRVALVARLSGFGGEAGPGRFESVDGPVRAEGVLGNLAARARLRVAGLALPDASRTVAGLRTSFAGTPLAPTGAAASAAVARLLARADAEVALDAAIRGSNTDVHLRRMVLVGQGGARVTLAERGGLWWSAAGWRADAALTASGGGLPPLDAVIRQDAPGAPVHATARLGPYRAGAGRIETSSANIVWDGRATQFDTVMRIDGPVGDGFVRGLSVPVRGRITAAGDLIVGQGCQPIAFAQARLASFTFAPARIVACGRPLVTRTAGGPVRIDAKAGPIRLVGRTDAGAPLSLTASGLRFAGGRFALRDLSAVLGGPERPTRLDIASVTGTMDPRGLSGDFAGAAGGIANVPLNLAEANGGWRFDGGVLRLDGALRVSDAGDTARFNPLVTDDARLGLDGGVVTASATLREPASGAAVVSVRLAHDLADGAGHAVLDVPGIIFRPRALQPEKLTPLTLGVIANVDGTIKGAGRIDWGARGVRSSGTFGTERMDLAAALGPVTGISGQIVLTDLLGLVSAPGQEVRVAEVNPGVAATNGLIRFQLTGQSRVRIEDASWPFAGGTLRMDPALLDFGTDTERRMTFRVDALDAAAFVQQLDFPNISATGTFDGVMPMIFDQAGGRIEGGHITARPLGGTLAYVGELSNAQLGAMGKLAFDALKAIRYSALEIKLDGRLDGEMISRVQFTGIRQDTPDPSFVSRLIRNLPFRFNIAIRAPFRGLVGSARSYMNPALLLDRARLSPSPPVPPAPAVQPPASGNVR
ncbi:intermembrane phospholipid transport protein YdbH family protein [Sphingomonas sp.]|uniref:YdbH domain-containing protein n=1 Tax=Sphingomonas sp. TaxID=28214 RepID=UPI003B3AF238